MSCSFGFLADYDAIPSTCPKLTNTGWWCLYTALFLPYYRAHGAALGGLSNYTTYRDKPIASVICVLDPALSI
ncbi:hypothetical protein CORC01_06263 [Colletotrichum orchidophilum]|uniref:Uncharacterized protein n=1 Tax=Colletotrichum orchidophilum TaxID=1209926 RepID=A0A1G4BAZ6_9PEZI|nr:uncharacterized protein CORC01_06263 [Colletotrichum orchidophilum]OHE98472.1 hypothetical protein CORC01_06263 [Colletotrichum orchidophilum]